jgi:hypothetical protein
MRSDERSTAAHTDDSWQEDAARFLLRSGFRPGDTIGQVVHIANPNRPGRTFGSVWRAMRGLIEGAECAADKAQDVVYCEPLRGSSAYHMIAPRFDFDQKRAPPAEAMRRLFGASVNDAMP